MSAYRERADERARESTGRLAFGSRLGRLCIVDAAPIDPRDITWELDEPAYRVYFWDRPGGSGSMWRSDEWRITGADIGEVLGWAERESKSRYYTVGVEVRLDSRGLGLLRLHGWEPTDHRDPPRFVLLAEN